MVDDVDGFSVACGIALTLASLVAGTDRTGGANLLASPFVGLLNSCSFGLGSSKANLVPISGRTGRFSCRLFVGVSPPSMMLYCSFRKYSS